MTPTLLIESAGKTVLSFTEMETKGGLWVRKGIKIYVLSVSFCWITNQERELSMTEWAT